MADIELAIKRCKKLEAMLTRGLGASGRGLHEKVSSVESRLPADLVKRLRFIATLRNKLVHEEGYDRLDDRRGYLDACQQAERQLRELGGGGGWSVKRVAASAAVVVVGIVVVRWVVCGG